MRLSPALVVVLAITWTSALGTEPAAAQPTAEQKPSVKESGGPQKPDDKDTAPACRTCGGRCGLTPVCVCEPGTKKKTKTSYSMKCEPVCVAAPRLFHADGRGHAPSCTGGPCDGRCAEAMVRTKKSLMKTVTEEDVDIISRKVEYVCRGCAAADSVAHCSSCTNIHPQAGPHRPWWAWLLVH